MGVQEPELSSYRGKWVNFSEILWNCTHFRHPTDEQLRHVDIYIFLATNIICSLSTLNWSRKRNLVRFSGKLELSEFELTDEWLKGGVKSKGNRTYFELAGSSRYPSSNYRLVLLYMQELCQMFHGNTVGFHPQISNLRWQTNPP